MYTGVATPAWILALPPEMADGENVGYWPRKTTTEIIGLCT